MRSPRRMLPAVLLVLAGLLLAGCAEPVRGTAVANQADVASYRVEQQRLAEESAKRKADADELTSAEGLGDVPSLDLCSLIPGGDFGAGAKVIGKRRPSFGSCALTLTAPKTKVELSVGPVEDAKSTPFPHKPYDKQAPVQLKVLTDEPTADSCTLYLEFPDDVRVPVDTNTYLAGGKSAKGSGFLCRASSAAIDQVIDTVTADKAEHWNLPASSFGTAGACSALPASQIDKQLGKGTAKREQNYPGGHLCEWGRAGQAPRVVFRTDVATPTKPGRGVKKRKINGRPTTVQPSKVGELRYCYLETSGVSFPSAGKGARELAVLYVVLNKGKRKPCTAATALAKTAWRSLPD